MESGNLNSPPPPPLKMRGAELLLVLTTLLWGSTFIMTNVLTQTIPPMLYMGVRYLIATLGFLPFYGHLKHFTKEHWKIAIIGGTICWISFATQTIGIMLTTATKSAFLTGLNILMVPIFVALLFKKPVPNKIWLSTVIAVVGVLIMSFAGFDAIALGDILVLICDVFYAFYIIYLERNLKKIDVIGFSIVLLFLISFYSLITSLIFEPVAEIFATASPTIFSWRILGVFLYLGIIATMGATLTQNFGQKYVNSTRSAIIYALEPLFATFFAVLFGETLVFKTIVGGILIITGIFISIERKQTPTEKKSDE
jgi:drug/metabolite transporter (DMT)-like permease